MRRWLMVPVIVGLLLSMVPTITFAQVATPVVEETAPEVNQLVANPTVAPTITLNHVADSMTVPFGFNVVARTEPGATLSIFSGTTCSGTPNHRDAEQLGIFYDRPESISFQARWRDEPSRPVSECLSATWADLAPTVAPSLTIDGEAASQTVDTSTVVNIVTVTGATVWWFADATCSTIPNDFYEPKLDIIHDSPRSMSFEARWIDHPDAPKSECLSVTWENPAPTVAPSLTFNGVAANQTFDIGTRVIFATEPGATLWWYPDTTCSVPPTHFDMNEMELTYTSPASFSFRAFWTNYPNAPASDCLIVTWEAPAPTEAPTLTIDGEAKSKTVVVGQFVELRSETGATIWMFTDATCTTGGGEYSGTNVGSIVESTRSFQARWIDYPNAPASECLTVTWGPQDPTEAPALNIDGMSEGKTVPVDTTVNVQSESGADIWIMPEYTCAYGGQNQETMERDYSVTYGTTYYFQARWTDYPDAPASDCLAVTWEATPPSVAPALTIDGVSESKTVPINTSVRVASEPGGSFWQFDDASCLTGGSWESSFQVDYASSTPVTRYFRAQWDKYPNAPKSDCFSVTWEAPAPTVAPLLTIDGVSESKTVSIGTDVAVAPEQGGSLWEFEDAACTTGGQWASHNSVTYRQDGAGSQYFQARWTDYPNAPVGECLSVTWEAPAVTPTETATETPSPTIAPTETPVSTPTETVVATPSPTATIVPTETPTETSVPQEKQTTVRIEMWDGSSIEGASWNLYAPVASQVAANPYLSGVFGPNNTAVFTNLPVGEYRFVAMPDSLAAQEFTITISDSSEEIVLQIAQPATPVAGTSPTATSVAAEPESTAAAVTGLPETGSGSHGTSVIIGIAGLLTAAMGVMFIGRRMTKE